MKHKRVANRVMSLAENLKMPLNASIAFVWTNAEWAKPNPLLQTERANTQDENLVCLLFFSVSDVFADAKVMLCYA